jgi:hypothetical protein
MLYLKIEGDLLIPLEFVIPTDGLRCIARSKPGRVVYDIIMDVTQVGVFPLNWLYVTMLVMHVKVVAGDCGCGFVFDD